MIPAVKIGASLAPSDEPLRLLVEQKFASRLFRQDDTLWGEEAATEASVRLGWVEVFDRGREIIARTQALRRELNDAGIDRIVLSGMGGSSLAPEVICRRNWAPLTVLDSTHPDQVRSALTHLERTALVVSSKSGSTVETRSHLAVFEEAFNQAGIDPAHRVIVVTDPGSALHSYASDAGYRVFLADPNVGGRYSALTAFGLVPSVLVGADGNGLLSEAQDAAGLLCTDSEINPGLQLAAALAAQLPESYIFGTVETRVQTIQLPDWIEQLVAESTGKHGRGMLPVAFTGDSPEMQSSPTSGQIPKSMFIVDLAPEASELSPKPRTIEVAGPLGAQFLLWEVATAGLCRLIGVNPFDQPDVESAKIAARAALAPSAESSADATADDDVANETSEVAGAIQRAAGPESFIAIQAYLDRQTELPLSELRGALFSAFGVPASLGFGPRYLHSTGQFHKGGPKRGVYLQIVEDRLNTRTADLSIPGQQPGEQSGFLDLIAAQAKGDRQILQEQDRPVFVIRPAQIQGLIDTLEIQ